MNSLEISVPHELPHTNRAHSFCILRERSSIMLARIGTNAGSNRFSRMFGRRERPDFSCRNPAHAPNDLSIAQKGTMAETEEAPPSPSDRRIIKMSLVKAGTYDGELKDGLRHGHGTYKWSCGQQYQGAWANDVRCGKGTETWADGRKYTGEWDNDTFQGEGVWTWADGQVFQGTFQKYCPVEGKLFMPDGSLFQVKYEGNQPVFNGDAPPPMELHPVTDQNEVQESYEKMYEEMVNGTVFTSILRDHWYRQDATGIQVGTSRTLRVDEVFMEHDEGEAPFHTMRQQVEVRVSLDLRKSHDLQRRRSGDVARMDAEPRRSLDVARIESRASFDVQKFRRSVETGRQSLELARTSLDIARRVSNEMQRVQSAAREAGGSALASIAPARRQSIDC